MKNIANDKEYLQERYEDSLFALMMDEYAASEGQRFLNENRALEEAGYTLPEGLEARVGSAIDQVLKSQSRAYAAKKSIKSLGRVAVLLLICGAIFTTLFVSVSAFRETVYKLITQDIAMNTYTKVRDEEESGDTPQWEGGSRAEIPPGAYLPAWLPDGYILRSYNSNLAETSAIYNNGDNDLIMYFEYANTQVLAVDTEDAEIVEDVRINDFDGMLAIKEKTISVTWIDSKRNLLVRIKTTNVDKDTALIIAKSVKSE